MFKKRNIQSKANLRKEIINEPESNDVDNTPDTEDNREIIELKKFEQEMRKR